MRKFIFTFLCCAFICDSYAQSKLSEVKVDPNLEKTIMNFVEADAARRKAEQQKQQQTEERHDTQRREQTHQFNKKMEHLNNTTAENYFNGPSTGQQTNTNQQTSFTATKYQDIQNEDVKKNVTVATRIKAQDSEKERTQTPKDQAGEGMSSKQNETMMQGYEKWKKEGNLQAKEFKTKNRNRLEKPKRIMNPKFTNYQAKGPNGKPTAINTQQTNAQPRVKIPNPSKSAPANSPLPPKNNGNAASSSNQKINPQNNNQASASTNATKQQGTPQQSKGVYYENGKLIIDNSRPIYVAQESSSSSDLGRVEIPTLKTQKIQEKDPNLYPKIKNPETKNKTKATPIVDKNGLYDANNKILYSEARKKGNIEGRTTLEQAQEMQKDMMGGMTSFSNPIVWERIYGVESPQKTKLSPKKTVTSK